MSHPASTPPLVIDRRYRVVRLLGEGGMGVVYEAEHTGTKRPFAVKLIHAMHARKGAALDRFLREGEAMGAVRSPHVLDVNDIGVDQATGGAFMAMELLYGDDLGKVLEQRGRLAPQLVLRIAAQTLLGLSVAHRAGVVHRDIKPSNLFLARKPDNPLASGAVWVEGQRVVKVLDFGIAKLRAGDDPKHHLTKTGGLVGSPSYMSPEQSAGLPDIDHRTDIWSVGAVLYEALAGTTPYHGAQNLHQLMFQLAAGPPQPLSQRAPDVPPAVAAIVTRAMAHNPADRYASAEEMLADVQRLLEGPPDITEEMLGLGAPAPASAAAVPVATAPLPGPAPRGRETQAMSGPPPGATQGALGRTVEPGQTRRLALLATAILGTAILLAVIVVNLIPRRGQPTDEPATTAAGEAGPPSSMPAAPPADASDSAGAEPEDAGPDAELPDAGADGGAPGGKRPASAPASPGGKSGKSFGDERY